MKLRISGLLCASALMLAASAPAHAHFILVAPDSWVVENRLGDPQKAGPCGVADGIKFTATDKVTALQGGSKLHIKIQETIYHPGHYRVALSVKGRWELPADPEAVTRDTPRGIVATSAKIDPAPKPPVLADGLFMHHAAQAKEAFWETDVQLPNISCDKCTVQVIQFMEEHTLNNPGYFTYHHCADIKLTADPKKPPSKGWPKP
jgi:hypothetical protein